MQIGALFDWDGVIIDSSAAHERSWELLAEEEGLYLPPDHFLKGFGRKNAYIIPNILKWTEDPAEIQRLADRKEAIYREIIRESGIEPLPGVTKLLRELKEAGIPCSVGSSTPRINIDTIIEIIGLKDYFQAITTAEDVTHGKPHPEVFLKAAAKIQRAPEHCVVFEDAHFGIEAALAGGMKVIGVGTTHPKEELTKAHLAVHRLTDVGVPTILSLWDSK